MLREHTRLHALDVWRTYADAFEGEIMIRQGNAIEGISPLRGAIGSLEAAGFVRTGEAWCVPELMRVRALSLARNRTEEAISLLIDGLEIAHSQGALARELRLASTLVGINDQVNAQDVLRDILNRTTEGFGTRDYRDAVARLRQGSADITVFAM